MGVAQTLPREKEGLWLTKDNKLVMMHANMTVTTYKLTNYFLWRAQQENKLEDLAVDCRTIIRDCNIRATNFSEILLNECKKVALTQISVMDEDGNWKVRQIIPNMTYQDGILTADVNPKVAPYIYGLKQNFTRSNMIQANKLESYAAMRMYEACISWIRTGNVYYSIEEWRQILGGTQSSYSLFANFKNRLIEVAVRMVNENTDIDITPEYIKTGRKVTHMRVHIHRKESDDNQSEVNQTLAEIAGVGSSIEAEAIESPLALNLEERDVVKKMTTDYKQSKKDAEAYVKNYGIDYCKEQMEYVRQENQKQPKKRIGGYFRRAMEGDYAGKKQIQIEAARAEEAEHKEIVAWNKDAAKMDSLLEAGGQPSEKDLVESLLAQHEEVTNLYRGFGVEDARIARWIEKYEEVLLFKLGLKLQGQEGITADYIEANLNINEKK